MVTIRIATEPDLPTIAKLAHETWPTAYADILDKSQIDYMLAKMYSRAELLSQVSTGHEFLIASDFDGDVGFAGYAQTDGHTETYKLHKLYVLPHMQGGGVGRLLMDEVIANVKKRGGKTLQLNVNRANKALSFYKSAGFNIIDTVDIAIGEGYFMNDYVMEKKLSL